MTSLASVHTAAAIVVRALGDAGVSDHVRLELDAHGITVRPLSIHADDWTAVTAVLADALCSVRLRPYGLVGHIDDVAVTASDVTLEVIGA